MPNAAFMTSQIRGTSPGEHADCDPPHDEGPSTGEVITGSPNVFINGNPAARAYDSATIEDDCDTGDGQIIQGSGTVYINGKPASRVNDSVQAHHGGEMRITEGSSNVIIGD